MELCGGQTHAILKYGLDQLLPPEITLLHGPGCPVCVTPVDIIDAAIDVAGRRGVIFCSFGDMLRVPGSRQNLLAARAAGADIRVVYSPLDAVAIAANHPARQVVFFAIGFETTAPANAVAVAQARELGLSNFSMLMAQMLVPPAIAAILSAPHCGVNGFLAAGHVCTVMGYSQYEPIASCYRTPIVVTGFEPLDILQGIHMVVRQLECGEATVNNQYRRAVRRSGNEAAQQLMRRVFRVADSQWRGLGVIPNSGLILNDAYRDFDAARRFGIDNQGTADDLRCISQLILQGKRKPADCAAFGDPCTPEQPLGAPMVASEGACAAYYRYRNSKTAVSTAGALQNGRR
jgi:hydrogenase expression/formation protein HypD